jgi:hypothetical protein
VDFLSLHDSNVRVTGPKRFSQLAKLVSVDTSGDGTPRTATYSILPPGGTWSDSNNGVYTVSMQSKQVKDIGGNFVASGKLGTLTVDTVGPKASSLAASKVTRAGGTSYTFTVTYADNLAVSFATLDNSDILVTGPNGFSQAATFVSVNKRTSGTPRTATYRITPPGGTWDAADNGIYTVSVEPDQVADTVGHPVAAGDLGTFTVAVPGTALGTATLQGVHPLGGGTSLDQAAMLAAAADAALSPAGPQRKTAGLAAVFASVDDWLWPSPRAAL